MLRYQDAITVTDTYHETKSRFAWIGEIENEQLLTCLLYTSLVARSMTRK